MEKDMEIEKSLPEYDMCFATVRGTDELSGLGVVTLTFISPEIQHIYGTLLIATSPSSLGTERLVIEEVPIDM